MNSMEYFYNRIYNKGKKTQYLTIDCNIRISCIESNPVCNERWLIKIYVYKNTILPIILPVNASRNIFTLYFCQTPLFMAYFLWQKKLKWMNTYTIKFFFSIHLHVYAIYMPNKPVKGIHITWKKPWEKRNVL